MLDILEEDGCAPPPQRHRDPTVVGHDDTLTAQRVVESMRVGHPAEASETLRARPPRLVKTVGASFEDEGYAATRAFYEARGFLPLEEISDLDWHGPTLIMVKALGSAAPTPDGSRSPRTGSDQ